MKRVTGIILAAGFGTRMGQNKMLMPLLRKTPIELCVRAMEKSCVDDIIIVTSEETDEYAKSLFCSKPKKTVRGGDMRQKSVYNALLACENADIVVIHDGARCLVTSEIIDKSVETAIKYKSAVAVIKMRDTVRNEKSGECVERDDLLLMQTPQTFDRKAILRAYENVDFTKNTDDCGVYIGAGEVPHYFEADFTNQKLTSPADIAFFEAILNERQNSMRVGYGEDTHRFSEGRRLILGGVDIDYKMGLLGHSDADVLCHAIADALLGACAMGDIGKHFPDTDMAYKDANSIELLSEVARKVRANGFEIGNVDATLIAQEPKLAPHIDSMRGNISRAINVDISAVSVKATTPEHTGPEGRLECITARAVAMVRG